MKTGTSRLTSIEIGIHVLTFFIVLVMTIGTLAFQVYKVMTVNPSSILRDDLS